MGIWNSRFGHVPLMVVPFLQETDKRIQKFHQRRPIPYDMTPFHFMNVMTSCNYYRIHC